jgi:hypothetical protein
METNDIFMLYITILGVITYIFTLIIKDKFYQYYVILLLVLVFGLYYTGKQYPMEVKHDRRTTESSDSNAGTIDD